MGTEIERKFLVIDDSWRKNAEPGLPARQGYLCVGPPVAVRVRIMGGRATINVKAATLDITRKDFEYSIPLEDAEEVLALCAGRCVEKTRYRVPFGDLTWEVDVFEGPNEGLIVAEIELDDADQYFDKPPWAGEEVSHDPRYLNTHLSCRPFAAW